MGFEEKKYRALLCRLYAEFVEEMERAKRDAEVASVHGRIEFVQHKREKAAFYSSAAAKVRYACKSLGFDPAEGFAAATKEETE